MNEVSMRVADFARKPVERRTTAGRGQIVCLPGAPAVTRQLSQGSRRSGLGTATPFLWSDPDIVISVDDR